MPLISKSHLLIKFNVSFEAKSLAFNDADVSLRLYYGDGLRILLDVEPGAESFELKLSGYLYDSLALGLLIKFLRIWHWLLEL